MGSSQRRIAGCTTRVTGFDPMLTAATVSSWESKLVGVLRRPLLRARREWQDGQRKWRRELAQSSKLRPTCKRLRWSSRAVFRRGFLLLLPALIAVTLAHSGFLSGRDQNRRTAYLEARYSATAAISSLVRLAATPCMTSFSRSRAWKYSS